MSLLLGKFFSKSFKMERCSKSSISNFSLFLGAVGPPVRSSHLPLTACCRNGLAWSAATRTAPHTGSPRDGRQFSLILGENMNMTYVIMIV